MGVPVVPATIQYGSKTLSYSHTDLRWADGLPFRSASQAVHHWGRCEPWAQLGITLAHERYSVWMVDDHLYERPPHVQEQRRQLEPLVVPRGVYGDRTPRGGLHILFATSETEFDGWTIASDILGLMVRGGPCPRDGDKLHGHWVAPSVDGHGRPYVALGPPALRVYPRIADALGAIAPWLPDLFDRHPKPP
ncbi:MAG: hypothetical protein L3J96_00720 [Thermoplasmata archaeon]|nr:hypothetical protein [Thermoplasmata archaeon]